MIPPRSNHPEKIQKIKSHVLHHGPDLALSIETIQLPNGTEVDLEMVWHPGASAVIPFITEDEILLLRQYRWAVGGWIWEIPAGKVRPGEDPESCALRELREEVGQHAGRMVPLGSIWTVPGFSNERIHLFAAHELSPAPQSLEPDELIEVLRLPLRQAFDMVRAGDFCDAKSLCALLHLMMLQRG